MPKQPHLSDSSIEKARRWLEGAVISKTACMSLNEIYGGPVFGASTPTEVLSFLLSCVASEAQCHADDDEMDGVQLTIEFEEGSMHPDQLELVFIYSGIEKEGSVSFSLSTVRSETDAFEVYGDHAFRIPSEVG